MPQPGERIAGNKYTVEKVLAVGGMGVVLSAMHAQLGQRVAIKFLLPAAIRHEGAVARFVREARSAARLQNEHIVRIIDVDTLPTGAPFMVMEHLVGADLGQLLELCGVLSLAEAVDYVLQACEGIAEAHAQGIVHRDLKPSNLYLTQRPDGSALVKVLDFGISKLTREDALAPGNLTSTMTVMGSPQYMAPEQIRSSKAVDARTDVWSIGIILHELLAGSPPFDAQTVPGLCAQISADPPIPLRQARPDASPELEAVVLRCLEKDQARRFADVGELARALGPFASEDARPSIDKIIKSIAAAGETGEHTESKLARSAPRLLKHVRGDTGSMSGAGKLTPGGRPVSPTDETLVREEHVVRPTTPSAVIRSALGAAAGALEATSHAPLSESGSRVAETHKVASEAPAAMSSTEPPTRERPLWGVAVIGILLALALLALILSQGEAPAPPAEAPPTRPVAERPVNEGEPRPELDTPAPATAAPATPVEGAAPALVEGAVPAPVEAAAPVEGAAPVEAAAPVEGAAPVEPAAPSPITKRPPRPVKQHAPSSDGASPDLEIRLER